VDIASRSSENGLTAPALKATGFTVLSLAGLCVLAACSTTPKLEAGMLNTQSYAPTPEDPFQGFNRANFAFNESLDKTVLEPTAKAYAAVAPKPLRDGMSNFSRNLGEPVTIMNELLQGKGDIAMASLARFAANSTVGLFGILDLSVSLELDRTNEDFGQTLGSWGVPSGPYLVMPVLGSTNPRDILARPVDALADPTNYADDVRGPTIGVRVLSGLNARANVIDQVDAMREQADPYTVARRIFTARREAALKDEAAQRPISAETVTDLPDFDATP